VISSTDAAVGSFLVSDHLVRPVEELLAVLLRHTHQPGDRLQRKFTRHLLDEVTRALRRGLLNDVVRTLAKFFAQGFDGARGECARDDLAQVRVVRGVLVEEHDLARFQRRRVGFVAVPG
jgi:hypothetical protein